LVPIILSITEIDEDPTITDEGERWRRFGQGDHCRLYSKNGFCRKGKRKRASLSMSTARNLRQEGVSSAVASAAEVCCTWCTVTGYLNRQYAESLDQVGIPRALPGAKGGFWKRSIAGFDYFDAMGCYPIFACQDWSSLKVDLEKIDERLVCLSLVTDPFGDYDEAYLRQCFPDVVIEFKQHFIVDLGRPLESFRARASLAQRPPSTWQDADREMCSAGALSHRLGESLLDPG